MKKYIIKIIIGVVIIVIGAYTIYKIPPAKIDLILGVIKAFLSRPVNISIFSYLLFLVLCGYYLFCLSKKVLNFVWKKLLPIKKATPDMPQEIPKENQSSERNKDIDELSEEEKGTINLFAIGDDNSLTILQIATALKISKLRAKNAIERLQRKGFLRISSMPYSFGPTEYKLNVLGREFIVKYKLDSKKLDTSLSRIPEKEKSINHSETQQRTTARLDKTEERILKYLNGSEEVDIGEFAGYLPEIQDS